MREGAGAAHPANTAAQAATIRYVYFMQKKNDYLLMTVKVSSTILAALGAAQLFAPSRGPRFPATCRQLVWFGLGAVPDAPVEHPHEAVPPWWVAPPGRAEPQPTKRGHNPEKYPPGRVPAGSPKRYLFRELSDNVCYPMFRHDLLI